MNIFIWVKQSIHPDGLHLVGIRPVGIRPVCTAKYGFVQMVFVQLAWRRDYGPCPHRHYSAVSLLHRSPSLPPSPPPPSLPPSLPPPSLPPYIVLPPSLPPSLHRSPSFHQQVSLRYLSASHITGRFADTTLFPACRSRNLFCNQLSRNWRRHFRDFEFPIFRFFDFLFFDFSFFRFFIFWFFDFLMFRFFDFSIFRFFDFSIFRFFDFSIFRFFDFSIFRFFDFSIFRICQVSILRFRDSAILRSGRPDGRIHQFMLWPDDVTRTCAEPPLSIDKSASMSSAVICKCATYSRYMHAGWRTA